MLELPEVTTMALQLNEHCAGKTVGHVLGPTKPHKFCWFAGDPMEYDSKMRGLVLEKAEGFGIFVEMNFTEGVCLCFNDGVNVRLLEAAAAPANYQLMIVFTDNTALVFGVAMYGGIILHDGTYDNEYYIKSKNALSPFARDFKAHYRKLLAESKPTLSAKAFLGTEQRFPGIGNGVLQDILFDAGIHPKRKIATFSEAEKDRLLASMISVLKEMTAGGGRDTEKDLFGKAGGYQTKMSKNGMVNGCPRCGGTIFKESFLGGAIYFCPCCQPLP